MRRWWWTVRMAWVLWREGASELGGAYDYAKDDCWQQFRTDGYSPSAAWYEDLLAGY